MKKSGLRIALVTTGVLLGLGLVIGGLVAAVGEAEPQFNGFPAREWIERAAAGDAAARAAAAGVLTNQVVPRLVEIVRERRRDSAVRLAVAEALNAIPGLSVYAPTATVRRSAAINDLALMGPRAAAAVPVLLETIEDPDDVVRASAASALGQIQAAPEQVIPALVKCLQDRRRGARAEAALALGEFGDRARSAVPALVGALGALDDKDVWTSVRRALKAVDPEAAAKAGIK